MAIIPKQKSLIFQAYFIPLINALSLLIIGIWHINESVEHDFPYMIPIFFGVVLLALNNQLKFETKSVMIIALIISLFVLISLFYFRSHLISPVETLSGIRVYIMLGICFIACSSLIINLIKK